MVDNYNRLVLAGDAMLGQLREGLEELGKPTTLVFFGDHRPTIPGASEPGGDRHTPYVILRQGPSCEAHAATGQNVDLTPAQLHHAILDQMRTGPA
jgi:phosphoglycerol transferase MdoB-like AlkP superfamily enzyme